MPTFSVILAAAGRSSRFNDPTAKKPFVLLKGKSVWLYSAQLFRARADVTQLIVVISPDDEAFFRKEFEANIDELNIDVVLGGSERADSVQNALQQVDPVCDYVAIHDAARPCLDVALVEGVFSAAEKFPAVIPTVPVNSTIKRSRTGDKVDETVDRTGLYLAQTPQVYRRKLINDLYAQRNSINVTDESQLAELHGVEVSMVVGSPLNIKITTRQDLIIANACLDAISSVKFDAPTELGSETKYR